MAEIFGLSLIFDHGTAYKGGGPWWTVAFVLAGWITRPVVAATVATLFIGGARLREQLRQQLAGANHRSVAVWLLLLVQVATFLAFAWLTDGVQKGRLQSSSYPGIWCLIWGSVGLAMLGFWAVAVIPVRVWRPLAQQGGAAVLLAGLVVGIAAAESNRIATVIWEKDPAQIITRTTLWSVYSVLHVVSPNPVCEPVKWIMGTRSYSVKVFGPCSGAEGMTLILVFLGAYLAIFRRNVRFPRALLLLPLGVSLMWLANVLRIVLLVAIGTWGYPGVAERGFHTHAGWPSTSLAWASSSRFVAYDSLQPLIFASTPRRGRTPILRQRTWFLCSPSSLRR